MLNRLSIASTVMAASLISTGAFAQSIVPAFLGGAPTTETVPLKAPGHNRYDPYEHSTAPARVVYSPGSFSSTARYEAAHNRYAGASGVAVAVPFYPEPAAPVMQHNEAHNHYAN